MTLLHLRAMGSYASRSADPVIGKLVDSRYRVTGVIARGGMATVYRADDTRLDRVVALKVMHRSFAEDPGFVARFEREARAAAKLNHPHVVGVFDQGTDAELVWLAMDYVPGHPLREVIRAHAPLDPDRALGVVEQILSGLTAAHAAGFVHRDIKPENVLMTPEGTMKITDFGLARAMIDDDPASATKGILIGTVAYLAPEQVETGYADQRSDIYATGIVLFELLTGAVPFDGATPLSVAYRHVNEDVPAPSSLIAGIPADVDALVLRATARDPADRFPSALAFLQAAQAVEVDGFVVVGDSTGGGVIEGERPDDTNVADEVGLEKPAGKPESAGDDWDRIAAVALSPTAPQLPGGMRGSEVLADTAAAASSNYDSSTYVLGDIPRAPRGDAYTDVLPGAGVSDATTRDATISATSVEFGDTEVQYSALSRQGPSPLTPVTRKPPAQAAAERDPSEGVKSVSRFGRTKLVVFLVLLVTLLAAGGWWLGMRHNATDQAGNNGSQPAGVDSAAISRALGGSSAIARALGGRTPIEGAGTATVDRLIRTDAATALLRRA